MERPVFGEVVPKPPKKPELEMIPMKEGHMYRIVGNRVVEFVRDGDDIVPLEPISGVEDEKTSSI